MFIVGLYTGKAIMSMASTAMAVHAVLEFKQRGIQSAMLKHNIVRALLLLFGSYVISGFWSADTSTYLSSVWLHLPFVIFPFAILFTRYLKVPDIEMLLTIFIFCTVGGALFTLYHFSANYTDIIDAYHTGKTMRTPFYSDHIRFGMAVALAVLFCTEKCFTATNSYSIVAFLCTALFLVLFVHILSGKMAIFCTYIVCISVIFRLFFFKQKQMKFIGLILLIIMCCAPFLAIKFSPTFAQKWNYVLYSIEQLGNAQLDPNISDEGRMVSYKVALKIIKQNIFLGVGAGDVDAAVKEGYNNLFGTASQVKVMHPHNQFMMQYLISGILGFLALIYLIFAPALHFALRHWLMLIFSIVIFVGLFFEPMLEVQYGVAIHIFFLLLLSKYLALKASVKND
jgi:O-antigen ligase